MEILTPRVEDPNTSLLAVTSGYQIIVGRQHLIYQSEEEMLVRVDLTGHGTDAVMTGSESVVSATGGTRLATWATAGSCGESIDVYFQRDRTSALYYMTFVDEGYGGTYGARTSLQQQKMPLVVSWGDLVDPGENGQPGGGGGGGSGGGNTTGTAVGSIFAAIVILVILCCCCS